MLHVLVCVAYIAYSVSIPSFSSVPFSFIIIARLFFPTAATCDLDLRLVACIKNFIVYHSLATEGFYRQIVI